MPNNESNKNNRRAVKTADNTYAKVQPQDLNAERALLGGLLIDNRAWDRVCDMLRPESFYEPRNQIVYGTIRNMYMDGKKVDIITLSDRLAKNGNIDEIGGPGYIAELSSTVASSANIEEYAEIIAEKALARNLISAASIIETKAFDDTVSKMDVLQEAEQTLFEIGQQNSSHSYEQMDGILDETHELIIKNAKGNGVTGLSTRFVKLDEILSGFQSSDLIILAGRPAMGKTTLAVSFIRNIAIDNKVPVAFFSMEMTKVQVMQKLISNYCTIDGKKVINGQLDPVDWESLDARRKEMKGSPLYIDDTPGLSIYDLKTRARRMAREHGIKLIIIDYLQLMNANGMRFYNRQEEVSTISRALKGLAKELDVPVIALSQMNRGVEAREGIEGKRPQLGDLRESGAIEQDADVVMFVHRPEYYHIYTDDRGRDLHGMAQVIIEKHRKGATGEVLLSFKGEYSRFENTPDVQSQIPEPVKPQPKKLDLHDTGWDDVTPF